MYRKMDTQDMLSQRMHITVEERKPFDPVPPVLCTFDSVSSGIAGAAHAHYAGDLLNDVNRVFQRNVSSCGVDQNKFLHRGMASAARLLGLPATNCINLRQAANAHWWGGGAIWDYDARRSDYMKKLKEAYESDARLQAPFPSVVSEKVTRMIRAENVVRVATTSAIIDNCSTANWWSSAGGVDWLHRNYDRTLPLVDSCTLLYLSGLHERELPDAAFEAPGNPMFEIAIRALAERLNLAGVYPQGKSRAVVAANTARVDQGELTEETTVKCLEEFERRLFQEMQKQGRRGVRCELLERSSNGITSEGLAFACFQHDVTSQQETTHFDESRVFDLFTVSADRAVSATPTVLLQQIGQEQTLEAESVTVEYAIGVMQGVQTHDMLQQRRLFDLNEEGLLCSATDSLCNSTSLWRHAPLSLTQFDHQSRVESASEQELANALRQETARVHLGRSRTVLHAVRALLRAHWALQSVDVLPSPPSPLAPAPHEALTEAVVEQLRAWGGAGKETQPQTSFSLAHRAVEPLRQAYRVDENLMAAELETVAFGGGGNASLSGERFAFTEHFVFKTVRNTLNRSH
ncbi:MAG: hypothetical protein MHM6MM_006432 [Cercozoa sp. M6MM]